VFVFCFEKTFALRHVCIHAQENASAEHRSKPRLLRYESEEAGEGGGGRGAGEGGRRAGTAEGGRRAGAAAFPFFTCHGSSR
jgi:hypothetical protein